MTTFQELVNKQMEELGYIEKVQKLEKMLLDFGFEKNDDTEYKTGVALKLPDNPLSIHMYVFIDYRGFVEGKYYTDEYSKTSFRFLLDEDSLKFIFSEIQSHIKKMLQGEG